MCCCMRRNHRYGCLQCTVVLLLLISLLLLAAVAGFHLTVYFLTSSTNGDGGADAGELVRAQRQAEPSEPPPPLADQVAAVMFVRNRTLNRWMVESAIVLDQCSSASPEYWSEPLTDLQFNDCLRQSYLHVGLAALVPLVLVTVTLAAVCGLCTCPMGTLALVYLALAVALVIGAVLFRDGAIITAAAAIPLLVLTICLAAIYTLFFMLLTLLLCLVCCCGGGRRTPGQPGAGINGPDHEKMMKVSEEEFEIDDPNAPLYNARNGYSPQKRTDFEEKVKEFKYIDDDMSYIFRRG